MENNPNPQSNTNQTPKSRGTDPYKETVFGTQKKITGGPEVVHTHDAPLPTTPSKRHQKVALQQAINKKQAPPPPNLPTDDTEKRQSEAVVEQRPATPNNSERSGVKEILTESAQARDTEKPEMIKNALESEVGGIIAESGLSEDVEEGEKIVDKALKSSLRTYEGDVASVIRSKKASVSGIRAAEIKRQTTNAGKPDQTALPKKPEKGKLNWRMVFVTLLILLLVLAGGAVLYSTITDKKPKDVVVFEEDIVSPQEFFLVDVQSEFPIGRLGPHAFRNALIEKKGDTLASLGQIVNIYFTEERDAGKRLVPFSGLIEALDITIPAELKRNIDDTFMFGIHVFDGNEPYMIIKTSSYGNAFSGMLGWEKTIENDLKGIFTPTNEEVLSNATTTNTIFNLRHKFRDKIVENRDSRYIQDENEEILLIYSFITTDTIVITTNEDTLAEIIDRVTRVRFAR